MVGTFSPARPRQRHTSFVLLAFTAILIAACGGPSKPTPPAAPPTATIAAATPATAPTAAPTAVKTLTAAVAAPTPPPATAPTSGKWIDVDVTRFTVKLMDGKEVLREVGPVGVGVQLDTGAYESTQTGLFHVYNKIAGLTYDAPYDTYIDWWVGFDPQKDNGFHSFLLNDQGGVVNAATGRISNGCIRTPEPQVVFEFAEVGMAVFVHA